MSAARAWRAPEVVQTSAMDCGPAALKCVLEGHGIRASYGRLREACQTGVDGTSIDALEAVAPQLGLAAEQALIPVDHLLQGRAALPAVVVVRLPDGAAHFVVAWRRVGPWLQLMDPASGRRWVRAEAFADTVYRHTMAVPAAGWRDWAAGDEGRTALAGRLASLGLDGAAAEALLARAAADPGWFGFGALDAATRLAQAVVDAGGLPRGSAAARLAIAAFTDTLAQPEDIFRTVPARWWSVVPAGIDDDGALQLSLTGAVVLRVSGRLGAAAAPAEAPSRELQAALHERPAGTLAAAWHLLREEGRLGPLALCAAMVLAAGVLVVEALLFRGLFDVAGQLALGLQRAVALGALLAFAALLLVLEGPIVAESLRLGRHLEARLRMALLAKLPRLADRYFQSRPVSDMADRSHSLPALRQLPGLVLGALQASAELVLTLAGIAFIAPAVAPWALALAAAAVGLPLVAQPLLAERDLRLRSHQSALHGALLDALLALVPLRAHRAQAAVLRQHEGLLVAWVQAARASALAGLAAGSVQQLAGLALASTLLVQHFAAAGAVRGSDLLLVYWALKLPSLGGRLAGTVLAWPAQRNVMARLLEPLEAPEDAPAAAPLPATGTRGVALRLSRVRVVAAGHEILRGVNLAIGAGEHVAIVGASGAGKSTLLGLLLGWHRPAEGRVVVDGRSADAGLVAALRAQVAWVDPAVQLWNRALADNLGYASDTASPERLARVLDAADLHGLLQRLPQGLQTPLGEGGALLSGGEGQRVRFGRALLQGGVRLALLDEPFRGLDRTQRRRLLARARRWWHGSTLLCVTHDVGETLAFDRVLVVEDGRIVEDGAPIALAARRSRYAELLAADADAQRRLWHGAHWRRLRVEGGRVAPAVDDEPAAPTPSTTDRVRALLSARVAPPAPARSTR